MNHSRLLIVSFLVACQGGGDFPAYYQGGPAPDPSALSKPGETGNVGGDTVVIVGDNFGGDRDAITVVFGSQNADIISVDDDELVVRIPQGPIQGGRVDVIVATAGGQGRVPGGYLYDVGDMLDDQVGYILLNDQWHSCYGGVGLGTTGGCDQIAWNGYTGLEGQASFLDNIKFPNLHSMYVGTFGGSDMSWGEWTIQTPAQVADTMEMGQAIESMLYDGVFGFTIRNTAWSDSDLQKNDDQYWCSQISQLDRYRFSGGVIDGEYMDPYEVTGEFQITSEEMGTSFLDDMSDIDEACNGAGQREYDRSILAFCETDEEETPRSLIYKAEWPVGENFMGRAYADDPDDPDGSVQFEDSWKSKIAVDIPSLGMSADLRFPPSLKVYGTTGFRTGGEDRLWGLTPLDTCGDSDGDGLFKLTDAAATLEWIPYLSDENTLTSPDDNMNVRGARTYVRVSLNTLDFGWLGNMGISMRASITVPDDHNYDSETGRASVDVPAWVLYEFPSKEAMWGQVLDASLGGTETLVWGKPLEQDYGYLFVQIDRVTEYAVTSPTLGGDVIVAHASGDIGLMGWDNPILDPDDCGDCSDNDGDGWVDGDDPDCRAGRNEDNSSYGEHTCNDGIDNDLDGQVDSMDSDCQSGDDLEGPEEDEGFDDDPDDDDPDDDDDSSETIEDSGDVPDPGDDSDEPVDTGELEPGEEDTGDFGEPDSPE